MNLQCNWKDSSKKYVEGQIYGMTVNYLKISNWCKLKHCYYYIHIYLYALPEIVLTVACQISPWHIT